MRVLITGGRNFDDRDLMWSSLDRLHAEHHFTLLIHGDAKGADRLAGAWAEERGIEVLACPADWKRYGRGAGPPVGWARPDKGTVGARPGRDGRRQSPER